jgi:ribosome-associated protein
MRVVTGVAKKSVLVLCINDKIHNMKNDKNDVELDNGYAGPSRSQLKRDAESVSDLAFTLTDLTPSYLAKVPLNEFLREQVMFARKITSHIAKRRQVLYLGKQLRKLDDDELEKIRAASELPKTEGRAATALLHRLERWRDRLLNEGDEALTQYVAMVPHTDRTAMRQLIRSAAAELKSNRSKTSFHALFAHLKADTVSAAEETTPD